MFKCFPHRRKLPHKLAFPVPIGLGFAKSDLQHTDQDQEAVGDEVEAAGEAMDVVLGDQGNGAVPGCGDAMEEENVAGNGANAVTGVSVPRHSPLTYGKVFGAIPRMTKAINTPVINSRISDVFGLPHLTSSRDFKKVYSDGRDILRYTQSLLSDSSISYTLHSECLLPKYFLYDILAI